MIRKIDDMKTDYEDHYFVIEKISDTDYVMRGFSKCKRYVMKIPKDQ